MLLAVTTPGAAPAAAQATDPVQLAYSVGVSASQTDVVTASLDGSIAQRLVDVEEWSSIAEGVVAVTDHSGPYRSRVIGYDAATGAKLWVARDARLPLLTPNGRGLVFEPDNAGTLTEDERDRYHQSV
jgi:hypothetical protein